MAFLQTISLGWTILPNQDLLAAILFYYRSRHRCIIHSGLSYRYLFTVCDKQDFVKFDRITDFIRQLLNSEAKTFFGAVLPAATSCTSQKEPAYFDAGKNVNAAWAVSVGLSSDPRL